jgi:hypothetical protein
MDPDKLEAIRVIFPMIALMSVVPIGGWVITTWMRIKHGYPLDGAWGKALHPQRDPKVQEATETLVRDNAALRQELAGIKQRLAAVETIVTDDGVRLSKEIDRLALTRD